VRGFRSDSYGDAFADVYDDWYADITDLPTTVGFVAELAGRDGSVLELGVGTGRLALPLAAMVGRVVGIDSSAKMLDKLREHRAQGAATGTVDIVHGDMVDDLPAGPFDVVLAAYNTVFNLTTADRQQACFDRVAATLCPGGAFVVEAFVPQHDPEQPRGSSVTLRSMTADTVVLSASVHDAERQTAEGQFIQLSEGGGVRLRPWAIRWADPDELDAMAARSGLTRTGRFADYDRSAFGPGSDRHVTVYTRPGKPA
jgi:SAM-dependent methyltransferase